MQDTVSSAIDERYTEGEYLAQNPTFHVERSDFKASFITDMLRKHGIQPHSLCDVGCGAGEVLKLVSEKCPDIAVLHGYELSPQGFALCQSRADQRVAFFNETPFHTDKTYDVVTVMDVLEHVEDPFGFCRNLHPLGKTFLIHFPLDMDTIKVLRGSPIRTVRKKLGHLHYFNKDTALALLTETGFEIQDWRYTPAGIHQPRNLKARMAAAPRWLSRHLLGDAGVRLLGGYSLLVLASCSECSQNA